jgi:cardiolipin synthase
LSGLASLGTAVTGNQILHGNCVELLIDGDAAYPAMLEAISVAKESISLLSYIFDSDRVGEQFLQALKQAKARGVEVRVLIDHVGARYSNPTMVERLSQEGISVKAFLPTRRLWFLRYANLRNHRKILVVDGMIGFTGGTNIREGHCLELDPREPVQCVHFKLQGPVVAQMQQVFAIDWVFASGEALRGSRWFPKQNRAGQIGARGIPDGPDDDFENVSEVMLGAIAIACESVRITSPYFLPDTAIIRALNVAALRGVKVDIVIPSKNNIALVQWATIGQLEQLLEKNCRIYASQPPFDHSKLMVVDGVWSLIGSTNWDPRSLRLNFEFNIECYDTELAQQIEALIAIKIQNSTPITLETLESRSLPIRLRDGLARLASPYL